MFLNQLSRVVIPTLLIACACSGKAYTLWDESANGDLSNDRLNPTNVTLGYGDGSMFASDGGGDVDYIHVHLQPGYTLDAIIQVNWSGIDQKGFVGVQAGDTFTEPASGTNVANLLGWTHFGPASWNNGQDFLAAMGSQGTIKGLDGEAEGAGAIGFSGPLTGSDYTFWFNQTSGNVEHFQIDFIATPEPAGFLALIGGIGLLARRRRANR
jgi:hypothetical protein